MRIAIMATTNEEPFKSRQTKYLYEIIDKPMIAYPIEQALTLSPHVYVVARTNELLQATVEALGAHFVEEADAAKTFAQFGNESILVLQGDDFSVINSPVGSGSHSHTGYSVISYLTRLHKLSGAPVTYVRFDSQCCSYGYRHPQLTPEHVDLPPYIVHANCFAPLEELLKAHPDAEPFDVSYFYSLRVITRSDAVEATNGINMLTVGKHSKNGVTINNNCVIGSGVTIEQDVIIHANVEITGKTHIGAGTVIRGNTRIHNMTIGSDCDIEQSVLLNSTIGNSTSIGPFAYIRPGSIIGSHCRIGDFVEVKNSTIGDNSKASHLGYIGDAVVGRNVNFGCGSITVNYDGVNKSKTTIEDGAFVGSNSNLVAPITLGEGCFVAAGSTVTKNVEPGALAVARARQDNKPNWPRPKKK